MSGLAPVIYPVQPSSQCGQSDPQQDKQLMSVFRLARQQLGPPGCIGGCRNSKWPGPDFDIDYIHEGRG